MGAALAVGDGDVAVGGGDVAVGDGDVAVGDGDTCPVVTAGEADAVSRGAGVVVVATGAAVWGASTSWPVSVQAQAARATMNNKPRAK